MKNDNISPRILYICTVLEVTKTLYENSIFLSEKDAFSFARQLTAEYFHIKPETLNSKFIRGCGKGYTLEYWENVAIPKYIIGDYDFKNSLKVMLWERALTPEDIEFINSIL